MYIVIKLLGYKGHTEHFTQHQFWGFFVANLLNSLYRPLSRSFLPPSLNDKSGHMRPYVRPPRSNMKKYFIRNLDSLVITEKMLVAPAYKRCRLVFSHDPINPILPSAWYFPSGSFYLTFKVLLGPRHHCVNGDSIVLIFDISLLHQTDHQNGSSNTSANAAY